MYALFVAFIAVLAKAIISTLEEESFNPEGLVIRGVAVAITGLIVYLFYRLERRRKLEDFEGQ